MKNGERKMKVLIVIDYQNDFVADNGKLTCGKMAQAIEGHLLEKIQNTLKNHGWVYFTKDTHFNENWEIRPESKLFPIHCVADTFGHQIYGDIADFCNKNEGINKASYSMPQEWIEFFVEEFDEIELAGVATNICVLQNAIGLYNAAVEKGMDIKFTVDPLACASFDADEHARAIAYMKNTLGFEVI